MKAAMRPILPEENQTLERERERERERESKRERERESGRETCKQLTII